MAILEVRDLVRHYGQGEAQVKALDGVSFDIRAGEFAAIMGPSGSGKSTLLQLMGGLDSPTAGSVRLDGQSLGDLTELDRTLVRRRKIGFIFQSFNLISVLTAAENVALPLALEGLPSGEAAERSRRALRLVGLEERERHLPGQLSGGQQQRVAIARALVTEPAVILADEPTGNLDSRSSREVMELLRKSCDSLGQTVVLVTHDPQAAAYADRILFLRDGRLVDELAVGRRPDAAALILQRLEALTAEVKRHA
jgi:putative ABC transport system ATP-binding protein